MAPMLLATLLYPVVMLLAGLSDLRTMKIPNRFVLVLLLGYILLAPLRDLSPQEIALSAGGGGVVLLLGFLAFACGWVGGGDVKLMAVSALWLGAASLPAFLLGTTILGALLTAAFLLFRALPLPASWCRQEWLRRLHAREAGIPYGVAIAMAGILIFFQMPWPFQG